jgi:hypothetical protein
MMTLMNKKIVKKIIAVFFLFLGLLISTLLISKGLILFSKARFDVGSQITSFLIFVVSCLFYFITIRGFTLISIILGLFYSICSYLISDLIIVDFIFKSDMKNLDTVYFVIHFCSILIILLLEYIVKKVKELKKN